MIVGAFKDTLILTITPKGKSQSFTDRAAANAYMKWSNQREYPNDLPSAPVVVPHVLPGLYERSPLSEHWLRQPD